MDSGFIPSGFIKSTLWTLLIPWISVNALLTNDMTEKLYILLKKKHLFGANFKLCLDRWQKFIYWHL